MTGLKSVVLSVGKVSTLEARLCNLQCTDAEFAKLSAEGMLSQILKVVRGEATIVDKSDEKK